MREIKKNYRQTRERNRKKGRRKELNNMWEDMKEIG
jgi:hypothetical protein